MFSGSLKNGYTLVADILECTLVEMTKYNDLKIKVKRTYRLRSVEVVPVIVRAI